MKIRNRKNLKIARSLLRKRMTAPELVLWQILRHKILGVKFRRQFSVEDYVLDFYAPSVNLAIEVDGESHFDNPLAQRRDKKRDQILITHGIRVLRFTNREIMQNLEGVISRIMQESTPSSSPPSHGGEKREEGFPPYHGGEKKKEEFVPGRKKINNVATSLPTPPHARGEE